MADDPQLPEGWFSFEGWRLQGAGSADDRFASAHESHHKQLSDSTTFGALTRAVRRLDGADDRGRQRRLTRACARVQEAFASWAPAAALSLGRDELASAYPRYARHWDAMERAVGSAPSPYLKLHAAHVVARAAMQSPAIEVALDRGLAVFDLADLPLALRPDHRFGVLQRYRVDWEGVQGSLDRHLAGEPRWQEVREASKLSAGLFAPELTSIWASVNDAAYAACRERLDARGYPTLASDAHRDAIAALTGAARALAPRFDLEARPAPLPEDGTMIALAAAEAETLVSGPLCGARLLAPGSVAVAEMATGPQTPHLLLDVRGAGWLAGAFEFPDGRPAAHTDPGEHLRRGQLDEGGALRVNLLDVSGLGAADLQGAGVPVYALADISAFSADLRMRWGDLLSPENAALVLDVSLATHLPLWLAQPGGRFRFTFMRTEVDERVVGFLLASFEADQRRSHLLIRGMSPAMVGVAKAAFEELAAAGHELARDDEIASRHEPLLGIVLAHMAIEERVFGVAGAARQLGA